VSSKFWSVMTIVMVVVIVVSVFLYATDPSFLRRGDDQSRPNQSSQEYVNGLLFTQEADTFSDLCQETAFYNATMSAGRNVVTVMDNKDRVYLFKGSTLMAVFDARQLDGDWEVSTAKISPDGNKLAIALREPRVHDNQAIAQELRVIDLRQPEQAWLVFATDSWDETNLGKWIWSRDSQSLYLTIIDPKKEVANVYLATLDGNLTQLTDHDGKLYVLAANDQYALYEVSNKEEDHRVLYDHQSKSVAVADFHMEDHDGVIDAEFTPDGKYLALAIGLSEYGNTDYPFEIVLYDIQTQSFQIVAQSPSNQLDTPSMAITDWAMEIHKGGRELELSREQMETLFTLELHKFYGDSADQESAVFISPGAIFSYYWDLIPSTDETQAKARVSLYVYDIVAEVRTDVVSDTCNEPLPE
jgi:hypothetical protein